MMFTVLGYCVETTSLLVTIVIHLSCLEVRGHEGEESTFEGVTLVLGTKGREELYCMVTEIHSGLKYLLVTIVPCVEEVRGSREEVYFCGPW